MWELDHKEGWVLKNWCFQITVLEKTLESLLMKVKEESEKAGLKLSIPKSESWQTGGKKVETLTGFLFLGFKITADGDWSHEIKRWLLHGRKALTNLGSMLKRRDVTLPTKVHVVKAMVFPVVMYGYESWTIKKAEGRRTDAFKLEYWRRFLRVPWTGDQTSWS